MDFTNKLKKTLKKGLPFVVYKFPHELKYNLLIQKKDDLNFAKNYKETGFVFAPFKKNDKTILIPFNQSELCVFNIPINATKIPLNKLKEFKKKESLNKDSYVSLINKAIQQIKNKVFNKVVLSRRIEMEIELLDFKSLFYHLMHRYPNTFTYLWHHPKIGTWAGATPEKLLELHGNSFSTMALAGTQVFKENKKINWQPKEQAEQLWVTKFITKKFLKNKIPFNLSEPFNLKAGNLLHICTEINGVLPKEISLLKLTKILHPTPAVGGLPRQPAISFIAKNENYNREFYTGFLGIINNCNNSNLFVNLRCMQIKPKNIYIYVGGGITTDSIPIKEWQETEAKSKTLFSLFNN